MNLLTIAQATVPGSGVSDLLPPLGRTLFALVVVLGLLGGLAWMLRKGVPGRRNRGALGVESALALGERRSLVVVTVDGRRLLLGLAPNHVSLVTELGPPVSFDAAMSAAVAKEVQS